MLDQAQATTTVIFSTRRGEMAELIANAGGGPNSSVAVEGMSGAAGGGWLRGPGESRVGSLDDLDGIVVVGGDGTFFEVCNQDMVCAFVYCLLVCERARVTRQWCTRVRAQTSSAYVVRCRAVTAVQGCVRSLIGALLSPWLWVPWSQL